jgi:hypothetical protein
VAGDPVAARRPSKLSATVNLTLPGSGAAAQRDAPCGRPPSKEASVAPSAYYYRSAATSRIFRKSVQTLHVLLGIGGARL